MLARPMQTQVHTVRRRRALGADTWALEVDGPFPATEPGQFFMLRTARRWPVLLPRPLSIYDRADDGAWGSFLIKAVGCGTQALLDLEPGEELVANGPLGRPFPAAVADPVCVAGGVGLAPFLLLARRCAAAGRRLMLLFGGRTRGALAGLDDFADIADVRTATDDGSHGHPGFVSALLASMLDRGEVGPGATVFCCGPGPMMAAVVALCAARGLRCFVSLETCMACGYGVCNGCTVEVQGERFAGWPYSRACQDGPVYEANELKVFG
jgi:dihydroorotate dehydrogenase electron transfer subunit